MTRNINAHSLVYQALDQVLADRTIMPATPGALFRAIDEMQLTWAPREHIRQAETIAVEIQRLQNALQRSDRRESRTVLRRLKKLSAGWMQIAAAA